MLTLFWISLRHRRLDNGRKDSWLVEVMCVEFRLSLVEDAADADAVVSFFVFAFGTWAGWASPKSTSPPLKNSNGPSVSKKKKVGLICLRSPYQSKKK